MNFFSNVKGDAVIENGIDILHIMYIDWLYYRPIQIVWNWSENEYKIISIFYKFKYFRQLTYWLMLQLLYSVRYFTDFTLYLYKSCKHTRNLCASCLSLHSINQLVKNRENSPINRRLTYGKFWIWLRIETIKRLTPILTDSKLYESYFAANEFQQRDFY